MRGDAEMWRREDGGESREERPRGIHLSGERDKVHDGTYENAQALEPSPHPNGHEKTRTSRDFFRFERATANESLQ